MKFYSFLLFILTYSLSAICQDLPIWKTTQEELEWTLLYQSLLNSKATTQAPSSAVRAMGEWEEVQAISITWRSYNAQLAEIVRYAQQECQVIINCKSSEVNSIKNYLTNKNIPITSNIVFNIVNTDTAWIRDYGSYTVYKNDVDSMYLIDWKYNRPRQNDDNIPKNHSKLLNIPIYEMEANPYLLIATGGNLMFDGLGTAISSKLIVEENSHLSVSQIDLLMKQFFGTDSYIKFETLPYDGIHHIDMHMKLLDEETLLVGQYPANISDGPQIEANIQYLLSNFKNVYNAPYKIIRIPMPPNAQGNSWPQSGAYYRTYTNGVFVNKTFIYPSYYEKYDTTAYRILSEALLGYKLVPINCQPDPISSGGAIHCITNNIGVYEPLLISHKKLEDTDNNSVPYQVDALIKHVSGIEYATIYYCTDTVEEYKAVNMQLTDISNDIWTGNIPAQSGGTDVFYYITAVANSGKSISRPITAPNGYWHFQVLITAELEEFQTDCNTELLEVYPNPARAITCIPVNSSGVTSCKIELYDVNGRLNNTLFDGQLKKGSNNFFFDASNLPSGIYYVRLQTSLYTQNKKVLVFGY